MPRPHFLTTLLLLVGTLAPAGAEVVFRPVVPQPGKSIRVVSVAETPGGRFTRTNLDGQTGGALAITGRRDLVWTFREPESDGNRRGILHVKEITTQTVTQAGGKQEVGEQTSPLNGRLLALSKPPGGEWKLEPGNAAPTKEIQAELDELKFYLQRAWFPPRAVVVGDSWEFDPAWVKYLLHRDVRQAQVFGVMKLRQIRNSRDGRSAVVDFTITGSGQELRADGTKATAKLDLKGQVVVNLQTMLEEVLEATGTLESSIGKAIESTTTTLPINLRVTKSFVATP
jgi:hypothetical protein